MNITQSNHTFSRRPTIRRSTTRIVVHHTAGGDASAATIHQWHIARRWIGIGYHFIIRFDGTIETGRPQNSIGAHVTGHNNDSIAIGLTGNFSRHQPTVEQMRSLVWLVKYLQEYYDKKLEIYRHNHLDATECPGLLFKWDAFIDMLNAITITFLGKPTEIETKQIDGATWVKLKDITELLGFKTSFNIHLPSLINIFK